MTYREALTRLNAVLYGSRAAKLQAWRDLKIRLLPGESRYTACPICGVILDWAWCAACKSYV